MTVQELIEQLQKLPPTALVVQSRDEEGNGFSPVAEVERGLYEAESTYYGHAPQHGEFGGESGEEAVCLWPTC